jgi:hypothetical protein
VLLDFGADVTVKTSDYPAESVEEVARRVRSSDVLRLLGKRMTLIGPAKRPSIDR